MPEEDSFRIRAKDHNGYRSRKLSRNSSNCDPDEDRYFIFTSNIYRKYYNEHVDHIVKPSFLEVGQENCLFAEEE